MSPALFEKQASHPHSSAIVGLLWLLASSCQLSPDNQALNSGVQTEEGLRRGEDQRRCEVALKEAPVQPPHALAMTFSTRFRVRPADSLGNYGGMSWDPTLSELTALDLQQGKLVALDTNGHTRREFGSLGNGPGEWDFTPILRSTRNRVAVRSDGIAVADTRGVYWYSKNGRYQTTLRRYSSTLVGTYDVHLAGAGQLLFASESGKGRLGVVDREDRTALTVSVLARGGFTEGWDRPVELRNDWVRLAAIGRFPSQRPYLTSYRRTWDAQTDHLAMLSFERYGICITDASMRLQAVMVLDVPPNAVDARERDRELRRAFGDPDIKLPFLNVTGRQLFQGKWPDHTPGYVDVTIGDDLVVWALRHDHGKPLADLFSVQRGYLGTLVMEGGRLPNLVRAGLAWFAEPDSLGLEQFIAWDVRSLSMIPPARVQ